MAGPFDALRARLTRADSKLAIEDVAGALSDEEIAYAVAYLADHVGADTFGALLQSDEAARIFSRALPPTVQDRALAQLGEWQQSSVRSQWRWRIEGIASAIAPPQQWPALRKWVQVHDVEPYLGAFAEKARPFAQLGLFLDTDDMVTIEDLVRRRGFVASLGPATANRYASAARSYLHYRATRVLALKHRKKLWDRRPEGKAFRIIAARLHEQLRRMQSPADDPVFLTGEEYLTIGEHPPSIHVEVSRPDARAQIDLLGYESGEVRAWTDRHMPSVEAPEVRALLEWTLDVVHDVKHPLHPTLATILKRPSWVFVMDTLARQLDAPASNQPERRLIWRLDGESDALYPQAIIRRRGKNGRWSKGAKTDNSSIPMDIVDEHDLQVMHAMDAPRSLHSHAPSLIALIDHPRVERDGQRVRIAPLPPTFALIAADGGVRSEVRAGDRVLTRKDIDTRDFHMTRSGEVFHIVVFDPDAQQVAEVLATYSGVLPPESYDRVLSLLAKLQPRVQLILPGDLRGESSPPPPAIVARLDPDEDSLVVELRSRPFDREGPTWPAGEGPQIVYGTRKGKRSYVERDLEGEKKAARELQDAMGLSGLSHREMDLQRALEILSDLETRATRGEVVTEWPKGRRWQLMGSARAPSLRVSVQSAGDWFGVDGEVEVDGKKVPLKALLDAVRKGQRWVQVAPRRFAKIADDLRSRLQKASDVLAEEKGELVAGLAAVSNLGELVDPGNLDADETWLGVLSRLEAAKELVAEPPAGLKAELRDYQLEGFRWMARLAEWGAGACLADEMGLGKTVQALGLLLRREKEGPSLVVAPTSVGSTWIKEAGRFAPSLRMHSYRGPKRASMLEGLKAGDVLVTSYDILARDAEALGELEFGTFILDEAQAIKNARTKRARGAARIQAGWRVALTGTPLENHLGELWSLYRVVSPGLLGSWGHFRQRYAGPIERDGDQHRQAALAGKLRPFLLRRTKNQVASELPPRTEVLRPVELSVAEREIYDAARREAIDELIDGSKRMQVLAAMTRLRLLACHPRLVDPGTSVPSAKLATLISLLEELRSGGHRTLVFSQFVSFLEIVRDELDIRGIDPLYLVGATRPKERERLVEQWQAGDDPVFLISLKAGGTGLTLTGADTVIHLDPWWNPAVEDQASDRAHRIGQNKPVTIVRLVAQGTIEESVLRLHDDKRALASGLLEGSGRAGKLGTDELIALIRGDELVDAAE